jgi:hypothetical protein
VLQFAKFLNPGVENAPVNIAVASVGTLAPLIVLPKMRALFPYACMLIVLDIINESGGGF